MRKKMMMAIVFGDIVTDDVIMARTEATKTTCTIRSDEARKKTNT